MGYSESISAHTVITTAKNSGYDSYSKYNEQSRTRERGWYVDYPKYDVANACKQNARSVGKARAGKCQACAQKRAREGRGMVCASKEAHAHTKGVVDIGFCLFYIRMQ